MKISDYITNKEAQDILNHSHRKQMVLDVEEELGVKAGENKEKEEKK